MNTKLNKALPLLNAVVTRLKHTWGIL